MENISVMNQEEMKNEYRIWKTSECKEPRRNEKQKNEY